MSRTTRVGCLPGIFSGFEDVAVLSHEIAETFADPFVNNLTPWWLDPTAPDLPERPRRCRCAQALDDPTCTLLLNGFPITHRRWHCFSGLPVRSHRRHITGRTASRPQCADFALCVLQGWLHGTAQVRRRITASNAREDRSRTARASGANCCMNRLGSTPPRTPTSQRRDACRHQGSRRCRGSAHPPVTPRVGMVHDRKSPRCGERWPSGRWRWS